MVNHGKIHKNHTYRVIRKNKAIAIDLTLSNLKRFKNEVLEITQGEECGISFTNFDEFLPGDIIQAFDQKDQKVQKEHKAPKEQKEPKEPKEPKEKKGKAYK